MSFKPSPGDNLRIAIVARSAEGLPEGDLIVEPYWGGYGKDRILGAMIDSDVQPYVIAMAVLGIVVLIASAALGIAAAGTIQQT